jgi:hypothetical protein
MPALAVADTGEGLIEFLGVKVVIIFNLIWPFLLPLALLSRARKKFSFYLYSLFTCGILSWFVVYFVPQQLSSWLDPELTLKNVRIALVYLLVATAIAVVLGASLSKYIREFNDSHD